VLKEIAEARQYYGVMLEPISFLEPRHLEGNQLTRQSLARSSAVEYLVEARAVPQTSWRIILLSETSAVMLWARAAQVGVAIGCGFVLLLVLFLRQRRRAFLDHLAAKDALQRAHDELEQLVAARTYDLVAANERLQNEMAERMRAERVLGEAQNGLIQAEKMAVLGQLSAGITHELSQPLAALRTLSDNAGVLLRRERFSEVRNNLTMISELIERMGNITGQLRAFARKSSTHNPAPARVTRALSSALFLVDQQLGAHDVRLVRDLPDADLHVCCDETRLGQVLVNLFRNAIDAMKECPKRELRVRARAHDGLVSIMVADSGRGIPPEVLAHLFEPFFTTKSSGGGLGLGLAISARIVREAGGAIRAENLPGGGAAFTVELPLAESAYV
jgi:two-component system C4-dicarboxylate transport sensor histidine kinase DctB